MKPETKRRLAIEWLALLSLVAVGVGAVLLNEVPAQLEKYRKNYTDPIWSSTNLTSYTPTVRPVATAKPNEAPTLEELYEGIRRAAAANDANAVRILGADLLKMQDLAQYRGQFLALRYAFRESLPESVFLGTLLGIGIYVVLWIPRLTLRAIRIVKAKPSAP